MQMSRLLNKQTQLDLNNQFITTSRYLNLIKRKITGPTQDVLLDLNFHDEKTNNLTDKIRERILHLFRIKDGKLGRYDDHNLDNFLIMKTIPQAQRQFVEFLVDPNLFQNRITEWSSILRTTNSCLNLSQMLATFDKKTQQQFYRNFSKAMNQLDYTQHSAIYHPELLALKEKENIREVILTSKNGPSSRKVDKRFWVLDYPIMSYKQYNENQLVMVHLADPDAPKRIYQLQENESFLAYVDRFPENSNATISFLVSSVNGQGDDKTESIVYRTCDYSKPFEKKEFLEVNDLGSTQWYVEDLQMEMTDKVKETLKQQRKVFIVQRGEYPMTQYALLIQTDESVFFHDADKPDHLEELIGDGFSVKLDVLRGLQDHFYFALRDDGAASDSLHVVKFHYNEDAREFDIKNESIPAAYTGEILAFEMDSSITNDVESYYHDNSNLEEW